MEYEAYDYLQPDEVHEPEAVYEVNRELTLADRLISETGANLFLTGKAGTGKTTFLHRLREKSMKSMIVTAPTGVAAINANGVTLHSFFQLSFSPYIPGQGFIEKGRRGYSMSQTKRSIIRSLDLLVIDEISMVRPDTLDAIDDVLRRVRNSEKPFGGVQLLLIGDIRQLSPVVKEDEWQLLRRHYASPYFFESHALRKVGFETIELTSVYRQSDPDFIRILNAVRDGHADSAVLESLNKRYDPRFAGSDGDGYIRLTTHNYIANRLNDTRLRLLTGDAVSFDAEITGNFPESSFPADKTLALKVGARVMFVKNDTGTSRSYYNGMIGTVTDIDEEYGIVTVVPDDGSSPVKTGKAEWENSKYTVSGDGEMAMTVDGVFRQIPLRLAWAITIHKSQGLTFDRAIIDAASSFAPGQTYVALSRCRSLKGMVLSTPVTPAAVIIDPTVNAFIDNVSRHRPDENYIKGLVGEYARRIVAEIFDFKRLRYAFSDFERAMKEYVLPLYPELYDTIDAESDRMQEQIEKVGTRFIQLYAARPIDPDALPGSLLADKIRGGCRYFGEELTAMAKSFEGIRIHLDNQQYMLRLNNAYRAFREELLFRIAILEGLREVGFSTAEYLRIKSRMLLKEESGGNSYADFIMPRRKEDTVDNKEKTTEGKKRNEKKTPSKKLPVGYSQHLSYTMFLDGKNIETIAEERNLKPTTIAGHLGEYLTKGLLTIEQMVPAEHIEIMKAAFEKTQAYGEVKALISDRIPDYQLSLYNRVRPRPGTAPHIG